MVVTDIALAGLSKAMDGLAGVMRESIDFAQKADKASLALGMSFGQASDKLSGSMDGLRGGIQDKFGAALATMEAGLQGNTKGIALLYQQQKMTGQSTAKTIKTMASLETALGASREDTEALSKNLIETSTKYGVSTETLVGSLASLEKAFPAAKLAGLGPELTTAVATLQAELGPQLAGPLEAVMGAIMDTSQQGFENLIKLGIGDVREQLAAEKTAEGKLEILKAAIVTASETTKDFAGGADTFFRQVGITTETLGKASLDIMTVADNLGKRQETQADATDEFFNQIDVMKNEALEPLQMLFTDLFNEVKPFLPVVKELVQEGFTDLSNFLRGLIADAGGLPGIISSIRDTFYELKPNLIAFKDQVVNFVTKHFDSLKTAVITITGVLVGLQVAALLPMKLIMTALIIPIKLLATGILAITGPIGLVVAGIAALGALLYKFGVFDPLIEGVKKAFTGLKSGLGKFLEGLGDMVPDWLGGGKISEMGQSLQGAIQENTQAVTTSATSSVKITKDDLIIADSLKEANEKAAKAYEDAMAKVEMYEDRQTQGKGSAHVNQQFIEEYRRLAEKAAAAQQRLIGMNEVSYRALVDQHQEAQAARNATMESSRSVDNKTPEPEQTQSSFLSETANSLGNAIESILGIGGDSSQQETNEHLAVIAAATLQTAGNTEGVAGVPQQGM